MSTLTNQIPSNASTEPSRDSRSGGCPLHKLFQVPTPAGAHRPEKLTIGGIAVVGYGLLAYAAFQGVILYAICFVGNWFVPRSIDTGPDSSSLGEAVGINSGLLALFVLQHTLMARRWFKAAWTRVIPASIERSTFVLAASAALGLVLWQWRPLPTVIWSVEHPILVWLLNGISLLGWGIVFASSFMVSHTELFGLRQVIFGLLGRDYSPVGFRLVGLYRLVRHPLMVGFLLAFWSTPVMTLGHLLFAQLTTAYIFFGTWIEERDLIAEHGESYLAYRRRVRGFLPIPTSGGAKEAA